VVSKTLFSSVSEDWQTPKSLYDEFNKHYHFDLDPCTTKENPLGTTYFYTKEDNGLEKPWHGNVFVNPPYNREIEKWLKKAKYELEKGFAMNVVFLLPARTDTLWFHKYICTKFGWSYRYGVNVKFLKGRLKFTNSKNSAPFPSMIVTFRR
jgi:site-specific DNA-methyltransferase (adenine-specific)